MKQVYRFFYHYNKKEKKMSVHFNKQCFIAKHIKCDLPTESKYNKSQPNLVMQGFATSVYKDKKDVIHII